MGNVIRPNAKPCTVTGCEKPRRGSTYCDMHLTRIRRQGHPGEAARRRVPNRTPAKEAAIEAFSRIGWVVMESGCWHWLGPTRAGGYGEVRRFGAHRISYEIANGPIPEGMFICHRCDNPPCVNPEHLFAGTPAENTADAVAKSRMAHGERQGGARLTDAKVIEIRARVAAGEVQRRLAEEFAVSYMTISLIKNRRIWKHLA